MTRKQWAHDITRALVLAVVPIALSSGCAAEAQQSSLACDAAQSNAPSNIGKNVVWHGRIDGNSVSSDGKGKVTIRHVYVCTTPTGELLAKGRFVFDVHDSETVGDLKDFKDLQTIRGIIARYDDSVRVGNSFVTMPVLAKVKRGPVSSK